MFVAGYDIQDSLFGNRQRLLHSGVEEPPRFQGHESVGVEEVFFQFETAILTIDLVNPVIRHTMAQDQVLSTGWRPDGVCLHEAEFADGPAQSRRRKQRRCDGVVLQIAQCNVHGRVS